MRKILALLVPIGLLAVLFGCQGDDPAAPRPNPPTIESTVIAPEADPIVVSPPETEFSGKLSDYISFDSKGNLTINNPTSSTYEGEFCYFWDGPHPQDLIWEGNTKVLPGQHRVYPVPSIKLPEGECGNKAVQGDAGAFSFDCSHPSNQLANSGTDDLHAYVYFTVEGSPCEKPCEPEWVPGEWEVVDQTNSDCVLTQKDFSSSTGWKHKNCPGTYTITLKERQVLTNSCTNETKEVFRTRTETKACETACKYPHH